MLFSSRPRCARTKRSSLRHFRPRLETLEDRLAPATYTVVNTDNSGTGSLRQAILDANGNGGLDTIAFNIVGAGVHTISPGSVLPTINDSVRIDGWTQGGPGYTGVPLIELNGAGAGPSVSGLRIIAGSSLVQGLIINRFDGHGILLENRGSNAIYGNYIGTNAQGDAALGNGNSGIMIDGASDNRFNQIGVTDPTRRNVISGNGIHGIVMFRSGARDNAVENNYIGTNAAGTAALGNANSGVALDGGAHHNRIGADGGFLQGNLISGNGIHGIIMNGLGVDHNLVAGNLIGTDRTGMSPLGNGVDGMRIDNGSANTIGGLDSRMANLISANGVFGILIFNGGAANNVVIGNNIGTNRDGAAPLANGQAGVAIQQAAHDNRVEKNVLSGNGTFGVTLDHAGSANALTGNRIGTDRSGAAPLGNGHSGVMIRATPNTIVGGTDSGTRNVVSANGIHGIVLFEAGATGNVLKGNYVGTNAAGTASLGNVQAGIAVDGGADSNRIGTDGNGTDDAAEGNLISGNQGAGMLLIGSFTFGNTVAGNRIGTDVSGLLPLGNLGDGVFIGFEANFNRIGTDGNGVADALEGNVISGNQGHGIRIDHGIINTVAGNFIGTDRSGTAVLGNGAGGILMLHGAAENRIGGATSVLGNTIAFHDVGAGVSVLDAGTSNTIRGNAIYANGALGIAWERTASRPTTRGTPTPGPTSYKTSRCS
jgi:hypothetical protein